MQRRRPNPFTSWEGCLLSSTMWGLSFLFAFVGGAYLGSLWGGYEYSALLAVAAVYIVTRVPWRLWLIRYMRELQGQRDPGDDSPPGS